MTGQLSLFDQQPEEDNAKDHGCLPDIVQEIEPIALDKDRASTRLIELIPDGATLELVRHYETRSVQVSRILSLLEKACKAGESYSRDEISQQLNMTRAAGMGTINVMRRMALIDGQNVITPLGLLVLSTSPYLDDLGLLWLLHYLLASDAQLILWANLFDRVLLDKDQITVTEAAEDYQSLAGRWSEYSVKKKIPQELKAIFKTYTQELFSYLRLIRESKDGVYESFWETGKIPPLIWLSVLLIYRDRYYPGVASLEVPLIVRGHFSPGRILRQNEAAVRRSLDEMHNNGMLTIETRSGLDQVRFKREITWLKAAAQYLQREKN